MEVNQGGMLFIPAIHSSWNHGSTFSSSLELSDITKLGVRCAPHSGTGTTAPALQGASQFDQQPCIDCQSSSSAFH